MTADITRQEAQAAYLHGLRHRTLYRVQLSALYHQKRERFFDLLDKGSKAVSIIGASSALLRASPGSEVPASILLTIAVVSTAALVLGFADRARRHSELARSFRALEAQIVGKGEREYTEADLSKWASDFGTLESTEPAALGALVVDCQNELAYAADQPANITPIAWFKRATKHVIDWRMWREDGSAQAAPAKT